MSKKTVVFGGILFVLTLGTWHDAHAQNTCTTSPYCYGWQNFEPANNAASAIYGQAMNAGNYGVVGESTAGRAVYGDDTSDGQGVFGQSATGAGVVGESGSGNGVSGQTNSAYAGVEGDNLGAGYGVEGVSEKGYGVYGNNNPDGAGTYADVIYGDATNQTTGTKAGVKGESASVAGYGTVGWNDAAGVGVYGKSTGGVGVYGTTTATGSTPYGVYAESDYGDALHAYCGVSSPSNVSAVAGVHANGGNGVYGSSSGYGLHGQSTGSWAVYGESTSSDGVHGVTTSSGGSGVAGVTTNGATGVYGGSGTGYGVVGQTGGNSSTASFGVYGEGGGANSYSGYFTGGKGLNIETGGLYFGGTVCWNSCPSDRRLKENIAPLTGALDRLLQLKGVNYQWTNPEEQENQTGTQTGFIAQDVEKVFPKWVGENSKGFKTLSLPPRELAALEVESFRALKDRAEKAEAKLAVVEDRVKALENGTHPIVASTGFNGSGWAFGGLALVASLIISQRKRSQPTA
jgi:hypothetical protein